MAATAALATLAVSAGAPVAVAAPGPQTVCPPTDGTSAPCVDPLASADPEPVAAAQAPQENTWPVFDNVAGTWGNFGGGWRTPKISYGAHQIYVATAYSGAAQGPGVYAYNENTPTQVSRFVPLPASELGVVGGLAFYHDELYVAGRDTWGAPSVQRIWVYDSNLALKRVLRVRTLNDEVVTGIDVAWNTIVARTYSSTDLNTLSLLDPQAGTLRGIIPLGRNSWVNQRGIWEDYTGSAEPKDVAISPELDVISSGTYSVHRSTGLDALAFDPNMLLNFTKVGWTYKHLTTLNKVGDYACGSPDQNDSAVGSYAPWGMKWLQEITSCGRAQYTNAPVALVEESSLAVDPTAGAVQRTRGRAWETNTQNPSDLAYQAHEPRLTWNGRPTDTTWQHGTQTLNYAASSGDYYILGDSLEHWYQPAHGFQRVELTATSQATGTNYTLATSTAAIGALSVNEDSVPSGLYSLTLTAYLDGDRTLTKTNPDFHVDHDPPSGQLIEPETFVNGTVTYSGQMADPHSGARAWTFEVLLPGGNWVAPCGDLAPDSSGHASCAWSSNSGGYPDGSYSVRARMVDHSSEGGNTSYTATLGDVQVDNTEPWDNTLAQPYDDAGPGVGDPDPEPPPATPTDQDMYEPYSEGPQPVCAADDPWIQDSSPLYDENSTGGATPEAGLLKFLALPVAPAIPVAYFAKAETAADHVVFTATEGGVIRASAVVVNEPGNGWLTTSLTTCSLFPLTAQASPTTTALP
jgi:hypothetical protein